MKKQTLFAAFFVSLAASLASTVAAPAADAEKTVKVFILAGQSNMEGKAANTLLDRRQIPRRKTSSPTCATATSGRYATMCSSSFWDARAR